MKTGFFSSKKIGFSLLALAAGLCLSGRAYAVFPDLVTNGGFETGDFSGWTLVGDPTATIVYNASTFSGFGDPAVWTSIYAGTFSAGFGDDAVDSLSQNIATTVGEHYDLSFEFQSDGFTPNSFEVTWDGTVLSDQTNISVTGGWVTVTYDALPVTTSLTTLTLAGRDDNGQLELDNVVVAVPEPATVALLLGAGTLGFAVLRRRKARSA